MTVQSNKRGFSSSARTSNHFLILMKRYLVQLDHALQSYTAISLEYSRCVLMK